MGGGQKPPSDPKAVEAELDKILTEFRKYQIINADGLTENFSPTKQKLMALIKSSNLALLERVEEELLPGEVHMKHVCPDDGCLGYKARKALRAEQRQKLISLRAEYNPDDGVTRL